MVFCTPEFILLFSLCLGGLLALTSWARGQQLWLLVVSAIFYGFFDYRFLGLLALSIVLDFYFALAIERWPQWRLALLRASIVCNLSILGFFKYFDFFSARFAEVFTGLGFPYDPLLLKLTLPLGISFYTFQSMAYVIDVYRGKQPASRDFITFALFLSFFPQLVAGPIERARDLLPQLVGPFQITSKNLVEGLALILLGFVKKALIADTLGNILVDPIYGDQSSAGPTSAEVLIAAVAFTLQVYCDFSGYVDIGRGCARIIGVHLRENFRAPFFSRTIAEFWDRWNISISHWFRDYVFIPLGGSRKGTVRTYFNIALTMVLCGFWHGAENKYLVWGAFYALFQLLHRYIFHGRTPHNSLIWRLAGPCATFAVVVAASFIFRATHGGQVIALVEALLRFDSLSSDHRALSQIPLLFVAGSFVALEHWWIVRATQWRWWEWSQGRLAICGIVAGLCAGIVLLLGSVLSSRAFIYFQF